MSKLGFKMHLEFEHRLLFGDRYLPYTLFNAGLDNWLFCLMF